MLPEIQALRRVETMEERCKHDLLPAQCGFCPVTSSEPSGHVNDPEFVAWLGKFARPPESPKAAAGPARPTLHGRRTAPSTSAACPRSGIAGLSDPLTRARPLTRG